MSRERLRAFLPYAALFILCGSLTAWWVVSARIPESADQAVVALMARHILEGRGHPVFYWGATYGGTLEPHLLAPVFAVFGAAPGVFRAFYAGLWALWWVGTAAYAARFFGRLAGLLTAAYLAVPPFFLPYKVLTSDGAYASVALASLAVLWLATEADERLESGRGAGAWLALLGLVAGVGVWVTPVTLPVVAVGLVWLEARPGRRTSPGALAACGLFALLGAAPAIAWNLRHAGQSFVAREMAPVSVASLASNLARFFGESLPVLLGAARPNFAGVTEPSFPGAFVVVPLVAALLTVPAIASARGDRRVRLLIGIVGILCAASVFVARFAPREPRYMVGAYAALAPLLAVGVARAASGRARVLAAAGFVLLLASNLSGEFRARRHTEDTDDAQVTGPLPPLLSELEALHVTRVYANYWTAYRITFESRGAILGTPIAREDFTRNAEWDAAVRAATDPAVVLLPPRDACFRAALRESGAPFGEARVGSFAVFHALPLAVRDLVAAAGALPMPSAAYRVGWEGASLPARVAPGAAAPASIRVLNEGPCTWRNNVRLVASWTGPSASEQAFATPGRGVAPGERADLAFTLRAPAAPGAYVLTLDLEQEGIARFSAKSGTAYAAAVAVGP